MSTMRLHPLPESLTDLLKAVLLLPLLFWLLRPVFSVQAAHPGCALRFDAATGTWSFDGVVVEQAVYPWPDRTHPIPVVRVDCGPASVWVALPHEPPPLGARVRVTSLSPRCDTPWCRLAAQHLQISVWSDADFIRERRGPWYPWGLLFWRVTVLRSVALPVASY